MSWPPPVTTVAVLALITVAAALDIRSRRIPNAVTFGGVVIALAMHSVLRGWPGLWFAVSGWLVGLVLFLPLFALKGLGAGDVKLLAAIGSWLGPVGAVWAGLYGAIAGGVLAVIVALGHGRLVRTLQNVGLMFGTWGKAGLRPVEGMTLDNSASPRLPYALPLAVGTLVALWVR